MCAVAACIPLGAAADTSPNGVYYTVAQDGLYFEQRAEYIGKAPYLVLVDADYVEQLVIPDEVDGIPVKETARFENRVDIEAVTLGVNMRQIDFRNCKYIESFDFNGVKNVGGYLQNLPALGELTVPEGTSVAMSDLGVAKVVVEGQCGPYFSLGYCESLVDVTLAPEVNYIPKFYGCSALQTTATAEDGGPIDFYFFSSNGIYYRIITPHSGILEYGECSVIQRPDFNYPSDSSPNYWTETEIEIPQTTSTWRFNHYYCDEDTCYIEDAGIFSYNQFEVIGVDSLAFYSCDSLRTITLPYSLKYIGGRAFNWCRNLEKVEAPGLEKIGDSAFRGCEKLSEIILTDNLSSIGNECFEGCSSLKELYLGRQLYEIGYAAFALCPNLKTLNTDNCYEFSYIDGELYEGYNKKSLRWVQNPESKYIVKDFVRTIGKGAFYEQADLEEVILHDGVTLIDDWAFYNCRKLRKVEMPSVTRINNHSFCFCNSLVDIQLPDILQSIGFGAFNNIGATEMLIPNSVRVIDNMAFFQCFNLKRATIGHSVSYMGYGIFLFSQQLFEILCTPITPPNCDVKESFPLSYNFATATLYVPQESIEDYRNAPVWSEFANIVGSDFKEIQLSCTDAMVKIGETLCIEAFPVDSNEEYTYEWSSSDPEVATVDSEGIVLGLKSGCTTIRAKASNGMDATCYVSVTEGTTNIENLTVDSTDAPVEIYTLGGAKVADSTDRLPAGIYIVRQGISVRKIVVN